LPRPSLARRCFAEGLATFALVFAGCGAIVLDSERGGALGATGIAAAFGLVIMAMVYATGHLSGAHINPAVSAAFSATRHFPLREAAVYVPSQLVAQLRVRFSCGLCGTGRQLIWARQSQPSGGAPLSFTRP
jgi:glycerol uptake facilitator-like aquaporin